MSARLVSVIGPPASGKTTTAEWLSRALPARLVREDYAGNPFLEEAYLGRREWVLAAQLYFLFSRVGQLSLHAWPAEGLVATDYGFCQDAIYAACNLRGEDLRTYRRLAGRARPLVKAPDVLVHLDAPEGLLLDRIARRGRRHERAFTADFLRALRRAYQRVARRAPSTVLTVDVAKVDLREPAARAALLERTRRLLP